MIFRADPENIEESKPYIVSVELANEAGAGKQ
jgi:hypothetical protein